MFTIIFYACNQREKDLRKFTATRIDSLDAKGLLVQKKYPSKSVCGGMLEGFYYENRLMMMDATYSGELGFTKKKLYLNNDKFSKIIHEEHIPEGDKYINKYPLEEYEYDPSKMTFADTIYIIELDEEINFKKRSGDRTISTKVDSALISRMIDCGWRMKAELDSVLNINYE